MASRLTVNEFVTASDGSFVAQVKSKSAGTVVLATLKDYMQPRNPVWGVHARNIEQSLALNLLMDPDIDFVTLLGQAGTGKTLITLAAALTQTLDERRFTEIIFTRATVSVGEEIGFLPGTEEEKMTPWMGALEDNLEVLNKSDRATGDWGRSAAADLIRSRIRIKSMSFMRGRTFLNKFVIIDEAQNLSPKQMKTLITRAGPGTKIVCMGNIAQIDTPYLTEGSSGLTYVVDRFAAGSTLATSRCSAASAAALRTTQAKCSKTRPLSEALLGLRRAKKKRESPQKGPRFSLFVAIQIARLKPQRKAHDADHDERDRKLERRTDEHAHPGRPADVGGNPKVALPDVFAHEGADQGHEENAEKPHEEPQNRADHASHDAVLRCARALGSQRLRKPVDRKSHNRENAQHHERHPGDVLEVADPSGDQGATNTIGMPAAQAPRRPPRRSRSRRWKESTKGC